LKLPKNDFGFFPDKTQEPMMMMMMMMKPIESDSSRLLSSSLETLWLFLSVLERTIIPRSLLSLSLSLSLSLKKKAKTKGKRSSSQNHKKGMANPGA
jgi:hypothetical protein